jgi:hypothetical protein
MSKTHHVGVAVDAELAFDPLVDDWNVEVVNLKGDVHNHLKVDLTDANKRSDVAVTTEANDAQMWGVLVLDARRGLRFPLAEGVRRQPTGNRDARWHRRHMPRPQPCSYRANQARG